MEKPTEELLHELQQSPTLTAYLDTNTDELLDFSLSEYLHDLLQQKSLDKAAVIKASGLNQIYGYQIFSGNRTPSRDKLLALAFGFGLNLPETQRLLQYAQLPQLYVRSCRDSVIVFALDHAMSVYDCNDLLYELSQTLLVE